jgi:hypothetical protein
VKERREHNALNARHRHIVRLCTGGIGWLRTAATRRQRAALGAKIAYDPVRETARFARFGGRIKRRHDLNLHLEETM